jgi:hypothetical protein
MLNIPLKVGFFTIKKGHEFVMPSKKSTCPGTFFFRQDRTHGKHQFGVLVDSIHDACGGVNVFVISRSHIV